MRAIKHTLRASTLTEMLVTMLVAGIILLSVAEGLTLFFRLQTHQAVEMRAAGREAAGYFRTQSLIASADSINPDDKKLTLFRGTAHTELTLRDSALVYTSGEFSDTLLRKITRLQLSEYDAQTDTVEIGLGAFTARFAAPHQAAKQHRQMLEEIENGYGYEE